MAAATDSFNLASECVAATSDAHQSPRAALPRLQTHLAKPRQCCQGMKYRLKDILCFIRQVVESNLTGGEMLKEACFEFLSLKISSSVIYLSDLFCVKMVVIWK